MPDHLVARATQQLCVEACNAIHRAIGDREIGCYLVGILRRKHENGVCDQRMGRVLSDYRVEPVDRVPDILAGIITVRLEQALFCPPSELLK